MVIPILAFSMEYSNLKQDIDRTLQTTDTISSGKTLNDIRFKDWDRSDWLDNEYIFRSIPVHFPVAYKA